MTMYRSTGGVSFDDVAVVPGHICNIQLNTYSRSDDFLQYQNPLTPEKPYFFAQIRSLVPESKIVIGIAGPDIPTDAQPGQWLDSVGYHSDTGHCYSSHQCAANTEGEHFGIGDVFGVLVTHFGEKKSTVIFLKNGNPVATRFLTEPDHSRFLPTLSLENGPIDLGLMWPEAAMGVPKFSEKNMLHWIKPASIIYNLLSNTFEYKGDEKLKGELIIQSPTPMSLENDYCEVVFQEPSTKVPKPSISFASCSPMFPFPSNILLHDYMRFDLDQNNNHLLHAGNVLGLGIHYNPESRKKTDFNTKAEQLVYCYFTVNKEFVTGRMVMQPEGGFYPLVLLRHEASKVTVNVESSHLPRGLDHVLEQTFKKELNMAQELLQNDLSNRVVTESMLRRSYEVEVTMDSEYCTLYLPKGRPGIHVVQFIKPLDADANFFLLRMRLLHEDSDVGIGVAGKEFPLNKFPGKVIPSVGWVSKDGKLYRNGRSDGNLTGSIFREGDVLGLEIEAFAEKMSVALFTKNIKPVGTAYYTQQDKHQFFPTVALCSNGHEMVIEARWQNMMKASPLFSVANLNHWCLPPGAKVDSKTNTVHVQEHFTPLSIQAPYSLHRGYNHYEVRITKEFGPQKPPPAVVLSTACPLDPAPSSCLKLDYLRFWPVEEASKLVKVGDLIGWGLLYLDDSIGHDEEQLVICYLTVNRKIVLVRVVYQPPGGFYPLVVLPWGLNEVTLEFSATIIKQHPITPKDVEILLDEANEIIKKEQIILAAGGDPTTELAGSAMFRHLPSVEEAKKQGNQPTWNSTALNQTIKDERIENSGKMNKMVTTITESSLKNKQLRRSLSKRSLKGDAKSSRSCIVL